jgi:hypothetical protein
MIDFASLGLAPNVAIFAAVIVWVAGVLVTYVASLVILYFLR